MVLSNKIAKRNVNDDLIRVVAAILVVMVHTSMKPWEAHNVFNAIWETIIFACNGLFFMLSGKYNLRVKFENANDYVKYYKKRFVSIIIPFLLTCLALAAWNIHENDMIFSFVLWMKVFVVNTIGNYGGSYLWFIYTLIAYIIATPFLSKMVNNMKDYELHILAGIGIMYHFCVINIFINYGLSFQGGYFFMWGWFFYYYLGYYLDKVANRKMNIILLVVGILGYVTNVVGMAFFSDNYKQATDITVPFMLFVSAVYILLGKIVVIRTSAVKGLISWIAKYTYYIYLIHYWIKNNITPKLIHADGKVGGVRYKGMCNLCHLFANCYYFGLYRSLLLENDCWNMEYGYQ